MTLINLITEDKYLGVTDCKLQIMCWVILLMRPELSGSISYCLPVLHEDTS